ncbi:hypothetical protein EUX98_g9766 [Antrodiella citrinella]|uniref:Uncharacterized protein n=1 Tax=Antrodiella citrinella TaxID=2447956 RepID=A0A4S4LMA3_9APHY|nr:hypothetical protein EUX98_g9766 [Antrodiella citrinella]
MPETLKFMEEAGLKPDPSIVCRGPLDLLIHADIVLSEEAKKLWPDKVWIMSMGKLSEARYIAATHCKRVNSWVFNVGMTEADVPPVTFEETEFDLRVKQRLMEVLGVTELEFGTMLHHESGRLP